MKLQSPVTRIASVAICFFAGIIFANKVDAANVTAESTYLCVWFDDVTDTTSPGSTVYYGGGLSWSGLTTDEITIRWYMDGSYLGGTTLTGVPSDSSGYELWQGGGRTWLATAGSHTLSMVVDADGLISESNESDNTIARGFTVSANSDPTDISISSSSVDENSPIGTAVGALSTTDPDADDTHTYTLVDGTGDADNASFSIAGSNLLTAASFNYEMKSNYTVRVRTTDQGSLMYEEAIGIAVGNMNEPAPVFLALDLGVGDTAVLQWSSISNHTYTLHHSTNLPSGFTVLQSNLVCTPPMNTYTDTVNGVSEKFWKVSTGE